MADRRLRVFYVVARSGSFTRAAEQLFMTQPAVTFQIKQLEEHFNARLLERGHGKVTLTSTGQIVYAYAEKILGMEDELETRMSELSDELLGVLNIGSSTTIAAYWLPQLLIDFKVAHPKVEPRVMVGNSFLTEQRVAAREIDLGLVEFVSDDPGIEHIRLGEDELLVICSPTHGLARAKQLSAETLLEYPLVNRDMGHAFHSLTTQLFDRAGIDMSSVKVAAELGSLLAVKQFVLQGLGYALATRRSIAEDLESGSLVAIPLFPKLSSPIELVFPRDRFRSRLIETFSEFCEARLGAALSA